MSHPGQTAHGRLWANDGCMIISFLRGVAGLSTDSAPWPSDSQRRTFCIRITWMAPDEWSALAPRQATPVAIEEISTETGLTFRADAAGGFEDLYLRSGSEIFRISLGKLSCCELEQKADRNLQELFLLKI